jgi:hypothetical protein
MLFYLYLFQPLILLFVDFIPQKLFDLINNFLIDDDFRNGNLFLLYLLEHTPNKIILGSIDTEKEISQIRVCLVIGLDIFYHPLQLFLKTFHVFRKQTITNLQNRAEPEIKILINSDIEAIYCD